MNHRNQWILAISIPALIIVALFLGPYAQSAVFENNSDLKERAHVLFEFEKSHPDHLPAHKLRSLSVAIEFGNAEGAERIINELESRASFQ